MTQSLRFGMYTEFQCPDGADHAQVMRDAMEVAIQTEALGFDVFCTLEHPFFQNFAINVDPLALFSAIAQHTQRLRFRALCHTLPLHNPMILAGQIAQADILTGGRLECGVGRGHAWLQDPANVAMDENQGRFTESLDILLQAWTTDRFSYDGQYYHCDNLSVVPKPVQKPYPPVFVVGSSGRQFRRAAEQGFHICVGGPVPSAVFFEPMKIYRDACAEFGSRPYVGFIKPMFLHEDEAQAHAEARQAVQNFLRWNFSPIHSIDRQSPDARQRLLDAGFGFYADAPFLPVLDWSYEQMVEQGVVFVGTPAQVCGQLQGLYEDAGGFEELIIMSLYGGLTKQQAMRTQQLFADQVMPVLRESCRPAAAA